MTSLLKRTLSGMIIVAVMVAMILFSVDTLLVLAVLMAVVTIPEFFRLSFPGEKGLPAGLRYANTLLVTCSMIFATYRVVWQNGPLQWYLLVLPLVFLLIVLNIYNKYDRSPIRRIDTEITAFVYIGVPLSLLVALGAQPGAQGETVYNSWLVLFYVTLIWINDIGAYLVGMSIGKHRLFERLSPKKSWEGFFGGLILTVIAAVLLGPYGTKWENTPMWVWIIMGVVLTLSAVAGDLLESMFKREAGVKDSGSAIPGHGGFLDRFDAMFISLPFFYTLVRLLELTGQIK